MRRYPRRVLQQVEATPTPSPSTRRPTSPPRLALLDGLRFLAALAVVAYHFTALSTNFWGQRPIVLFPSLHEVSRYGFLGVELFFFISGFVILMTAWGRDLPAYVSSRIARLFPAYWAGVLLTGALLLATGTALKDIKITDVLTNLTMLQTAHGVANVDGVYWTLWVELRFYILMGLFMLVGITRQRVIAFAVLWPLVGALASSSDSVFLRELLIGDWAPYFAAGMLLYLIHREGWSPLLGSLAAGQVLLAMANVGQYSAVIVKRTDGPANPLVAGLVVAGCFVLVALVTTTPLQHVRWNLATKLGVLTYPLYLVHEYWGLYLISKMRDLAPTYVVLAVVVVAMIALAWLLNRFVERPYASRVRRSVDRALREPRSAGVAENAPALPS